MSDEQETKVIFRWNEGECITIFPEEPGNCIDPEGTCSYYVNNGGHASAPAYNLAGIGRPATPEEYAETKEILERRYGYRLRVYRRFGRSMHENRKAAAREMREASRKAAEVEA